MTNLGKDASTQSKIEELNRKRQVEEAAFQRDLLMDEGVAFLSPEDRAPQKLYPSLRAVEARCAEATSKVRQQVELAAKLVQSLAERPTNPQAVKEWEEKKKNADLILKAFRPRISDQLRPMQLELIRALGGVRYLSKAFVSSVEPNTIKGTDESGTLRAVEIIPAQTALNVNTTNVSVKNSHIAASMKWLFGFGLKVDYQRQKELYDQFLQQETFASGFGKGRTSFGWTFGPLPGTRVINSGIRTTYAALVVPDDATFIEVVSTGCAFHKSHFPPEKFPETSLIEAYHCGPAVSSTIGIPSRLNAGGLQPTSIDFSKISKGEKANITLRGAYFSPQTTVLVNGKRLTQVLGIGKPHQAMDFGATEEPSDGAITGTFEYVNEKSITLLLSIPKTYDGPDFPIISLISPMNAINLNGVELQVNGSEDRKKLESVSLFSTAEPRLSLKEFRYLRSTANGIVGYLAGTKLPPLPPPTPPLQILSLLSYRPLMPLESLSPAEQTASAFLNGNACDFVPRGKSILEVSCPVESQDAELEFLVITNPGDPAKAEVVNLRIPNPLHIVISSYRFVDSATEYATNNVPKLISVRLIGTGFTPTVRLQLTPEQLGRISLSYVSPTELLCEIQNPNLSERIELRRGDQTAGVEIKRPKDQVPETAPTLKITTTTQSERKIVTK